MVLHEDVPSSKIYRTNEVDFTIELSTIRVGLIVEWLNLAKVNWVTYAARGPYPWTAALGIAPAGRRRPPRGAPEPAF